MLTWIILYVADRSSFDYSVSLHKAIRSQCLCLKKSNQKTQVKNHFCQNNVGTNSEGRKKISKWMNVSEFPMTNTALCFSSCSLADHLNEVYKPHIWRLWLVLTGLNSIRFSSRGLLPFSLEETHIFKKWEKWGLGNCLEIALMLLGANNFCEWESYAYGLSTHLLEKAEKTRLNPSYAAHRVHYGCSYHSLTAQTHAPGMASMRPLPLLLLFTSSLSFSSDKHRAGALVILPFEVAMQNIQFA